MDMKHDEWLKKEIINQFAHLWRTYRSICRSFDGDSWKSLGFALTQPERLALHILQGNMFYIEGKAPLVCSDGSLIDAHAHEMAKEDLPNLETLLYILDEVERKTEGWIREMDLSLRNEDFPWTGKTLGSVVLFVLRHGQYHLGEMNALLNEQLKGRAEDSFAREL